MFRPKKKVVFFFPPEKPQMSAGGGAAITPPPTFTPTPTRLFSPTAPHTNLYAVFAYIL